MNTLRNFISYKTQYESDNTYDQLVSFKNVFKFLTKIF